MSKDLTTNKDYIEWLGEIKNRIQSSQQRAALKVNQELLSLYWFIGGALSQKKSDWGSKFIENLARDLKVEFPDVKGFSKRNLEQMRRWFDYHSSHLEIAQQAVAQLELDDSFNITKQAATQLKIEDSFKNAKQVATQLTEEEIQRIEKSKQLLLFSIPWWHHILILTKIKDPKEVYFYIIKTIQNGWSRSVLQEQILSDLYNRQGKALTNFELTLPNPQADLAQETLKNPYSFDFLTLAEDVKERDFEHALIQHMKKFLLELGKGFAYVGNQYNLNVGGDDFFLDLLFFNLNLNCYVIFELKVGDFKPEFAGKLNMYVNTVNEQVKLDNHAETIGVLLCKTPNETVIEYSIKGIKSPLGVADYSVKKALPEELKADMPTVKELEEELETEIEVKKKPLDEKREKLMALINANAKEEVKIPVDKDKIAEIIQTVYKKLIEKVDQKLTEQSIKDMFLRIKPSIRIDSQIVDELEKMIKLLEQNPTPREIYHEWRLEGFKHAGTKVFNNYLMFSIQLSDFTYSINYNTKDNQKSDYLYSFKMTGTELDKISDKLIGLLMDDILKVAQSVLDNKKDKS